MHEKSLYFGEFLFICLKKMDKVTLSVKCFEKNNKIILFNK